MRSLLLPLRLAGSLWAGHAPAEIPGIAAVYDIADTTRGHERQKLDLYVFATPQRVEQGIAFFERTLLPRR
jgi:hypothetical protein